MTKAPWTTIEQPSFRATITGPLRVEPNRRPTQSPVRTTF